MLEVTFTGMATRSGQNVVEAEQLIPSISRKPSKIDMVTATTCD